MTPGGGKKKKPEAPAAPGKRPGKAAVRETAVLPFAAAPRVRKNYILSQQLIDAAREALGMKTETETIEEALRLAVFSQQLAAGAEEAFGYPWQDPFGEEQPLEPNEAP